MPYIVNHKQAAYNMVVDNIPKTNVLYTNTNGPDHVVYFKPKPVMNIICKTSKVIYVI